MSKRNELLAKYMLETLSKRNFNAFYCENKEDVNGKIAELISKEDVISWGGSVTLDEIGIKQYLLKNQYKVVDRDNAKTPEEKREAILKSLTSDVFLMSANAITEDGVIVNIDGLGNRAAALCFGPRKVIMVIGMNKVVKSVDDAVSRARNYAAPVNAQRVRNSFAEMNTPCLYNGKCSDCKSETSICSHIVITRLSRPKGRINVILVNDNLGY